MKRENSGTDSRHDSNQNGARARDGNFARCEMRPRWAALCEKFDAPPEERKRVFSNPPSRIDEIRSNSDTLA